MEHLYTGDASVDYAFDNSRWQEFPGNKGGNEPRFTHAHNMYSLYPNTKVIFMIRLRAGMYHIFVHDWIQVFEKENVLVLMSETT
ncbi:hypothetical protein DPMN_114746 [Dreissena polymorpha]|uniref:Uncharacterized protein n=1 Tax=Dreissena polymorpha TaxID=45954 RepID=A0A9D4KL73_DREPO|nr:hypothetical protein DPMN_114746 [Dreissena polymorpha]